MIESLGSTPGLLAKAFKIVEMCGVDPEKVKEQWLLRNETICICKGIPRKCFIEVISSGAVSVAEVNRRLGSGSGDCKGERCSSRIEALIAEYQPGRKDRE